MEKLWQVMGRLKEAPKEKRFNDTWTENTIILTDKPMSANYARICHIIKSKTPLVTYVGPVTKYLNCECFYNGKKEGFSASCCTNPERPEDDNIYCIQFFIILAISSVLKIELWFTVYITS